MNVTVLALLCVKVLVNQVVKAGAAKRRKTKAMTKGAGKSAPSYIKTKPNVKKPNEHKSRKPKPRIEHQGRKPKPKSHAT